MALVLAFVLVGCVLLVVLMAAVMKAASRDSWRVDDDEYEITPFYRMPKGGPR